MLNRGEKDIYREEHLLSPKEEEEIVNEWELMILGGLEDGSLGFRTTPHTKAVQIYDKSNGEILLDATIEEYERFLNEAKMKGWSIPEKQV